MRIAFSSWESPHSIAVGGVAVHVTELAAALERRGHEMHGFVRLGAGQSTYARIDGVHYHQCPIKLHPDVACGTDTSIRGFAAAHAAVAIGGPPGGTSR
jgi:hypothetical protein